VCELNSDTPSGEAEAVLLNGALWRAPLVDPNGRLEHRFCRMVEAMTQHLVGKQVDGIGIVYPTEMTEDLSLVALYQRWFEARGWRVTLGSPYNLARDAAGRLTLFGEPCDAIVRHYKTDWWSEREGVWDDSEAIADAEPLDARLAAILGAALDGKVAVINPFASVFTQNKRTMALLWERRSSLSRCARAAVEQYIPFTRRLETCLDELHTNRSDWVLKSDYGCEGDEVIIGRATDRETWEASLAHALPRRWIAQRYFEAEPRDDGTHVNYGVYVVGGEPAGFFSRVQSCATDAYAMTAATFLKGESTA
jgi:glutathionylspermidine synthase